MPPDTLDDARLLTSEIVSNAVLHGGAERVGVLVQDQGGSVRVVVSSDVAATTDDARISPVVARADDVHGRGLLIVETVADAWGVEREGPHLGVWFELASPVEARGGGDLSDHGEGRALLVASLQAALGRSRLLLRVSEALATVITADQVGAAVGPPVREALGAAFFGIAVADHHERTVSYLSTEPLPAATSDQYGAFPLDAQIPSSVAVRTGRPYFLESRAAYGAEFPHLLGALEQARLGAAAYLPLVTGGDPALGTMVVAWSVGHIMDADERALMRTVAGYVGQALARALLFEARRDAARTLQRALLPTDLPRDVGLDLAAHYQPAGGDIDVGGDWYDAFELGAGRVALVVGDVAGHGIDAATATSLARTAVRAYALAGSGPVDVVRATSALLQRTARGVLASMVYVDYDRDSRRACLVSAGHPPVVVLHPDGRADLVDGPYGPMLGLPGGASHAAADVDLPAGSALLLYTDGLIEDPTSSIDLDIERLRVESGRAYGEAVRSSWQGPAMLGATIRRVLGTRAQRDDPASCSPPTAEPSGAPHPRPAHPRPAAPPSRPLTPSRPRGPARPRPRRGRPRRGTAPAAAGRRRLRPRRPPGRRGRAGRRSRRSARPRARRAAPGAAAPSPGPRGGARTSAPAAGSRRA